MPPKERMRLCRDRKREREKAALALQVGEAEAWARAIAAQRGGAPQAVLPPVAKGAPPVIAPPPAPPPLASEPPPLPETPSARLAVIEREVEAALRQVLHDPTAPAPARIAAARSLAEANGLLRARSTPPDADTLRRQEQDRVTDPARLLALAEQHGQEIAKLEQMLAEARQLEEAQGAVVAAEEAMPWG